LAYSGLAREGHAAIGLSLGLPATDVWHAERVGFTLLRQLFSKGQAAGVTLHPELLAFAQKLRQAVTDAPRRDVVTLADFQRSLSGLLGFAPSLEAGLMPFFLDWCEVCLDRDATGRILVYRGQTHSSRLLFKRHLAAVEQSWRRGLRGEALAKRHPFELRGLKVTLGEVVRLLHLVETTRTAA
jgi:hypothetical protein